MSTDKYDRQTRLWGEGQILICSSRILCFNIDGAATELLKNLILAGTGYVALVDNKIIDEEDLKENFFVEKEDLGKNRAEACLKNLLELNPDVKGTCYKQSSENFLSDSQLELSTYDVIIVTNKQDSFNKKIMLHAESNNQRVVIIRNFGLINYSRLYENYHGSFQLRLLDNPINDLRVSNPFDELKSFCLGINLDAMDEIRHKHVPYVIILIQALEKFKTFNNGKHPSTQIEKTEFKAIIDSLRKFVDEENFNEAANFYYFANKDKLNLLTPELHEIFELLNENSFDNLLKKSNVIMSIFFVICKALQIFFTKYNSLPVVGNISDMTSDTETYITLKKIYEKKGKEDREKLTKIVNEVVNGIGIHDDSLSLKKEQILSSLANDDVNYITIMAKNWPQIHLTHYTTIEEEEKESNYKENDVDEPHHKTNFIWYMLIKAADLFYEKHQRYPGELLDHDKFQNDVELLSEAMKCYLTANSKVEKLPFDILEQKEIESYIYEFCRMSNSKIIPAVSIISSISAQEIIKLITYQFKSINNTIIYDGINSTVSTFKF